MLFILKIGQNSVVRTKYPLTQNVFWKTDFLFGETVVNEDGTLSLEETDDVGDTVFRWYAQPQLEYAQVVTC